MADGQSSRLDVFHWWFGPDRCKLHSPTLTGAMVQSLPDGASSVLVGCSIRRSLHVIVPHLMLVFTPTSASRFRYVVAGWLWRASLFIFHEVSDFAFVANLGARTQMHMRLIRRSIH